MQKSIAVSVCRPRWLCSMLMTEMLTRCHGNVLMIPHSRERRKFKNIALGLETRSSGYWIRLIEWILWVQILAWNTRWTFFTLIFYKNRNVGLKKSDNNQKEARDGPFKKVEVCKNWMPTNSLTFVCTGNHEICYEFFCVEFIFHACLLRSTLDIGNNFFYKLWSFCFVVSMLFVRKTDFVNRDRTHDTLLPQPSKYVYLCQKDFTNAKLQYLC